MKQIVIAGNLLGLGLTLGLAQAAHADFFDPSVQRGLETKTFSTQDVCVIPKGFPGLNIEATDKQEELCSYDFVNDNTIATCAKNYSTNPAVEVIRVDDKKSYEETQCPLPKDSRQGGKLLAKLKSSITCSYTPSLLAYYAFSKILGDIVHVPPSVIRTMDKPSSDLLVTQGEHGALRASWATLAARETEPKYMPDLLTKNRTAIYGAMIEKPKLGDLTNKKEKSLYGAFYGPRHQYAQGLQAFEQTAPFADVTNPNPISQFMPAGFAASAQRMQAAKDASDMILIDTLLNQQDRFGNVDFVLVYQYIADNQLMKISQSDALKDPDKMALAKQNNAVLVKELVLDDNDCGIVKSNLMKLGGVLQKVRHMNRDTYSGFMKLADMAHNNRAELVNYLRTELLFTSADINNIVGNILSAEAILNSECDTLKLDLDIVDHVIAPEFPTPPTCR